MHLGRPRTSFLQKSIHVQSTYNSNKLIWGQLHEYNTPIRSQFTDSQHTTATTNQFGVSYTMQYPHQKSIPLPLVLPAMWIELKARHAYPKSYKTQSHPLTTKNRFLILKKKKLNSIAWKTDNIKWLTWKQFPHIANRLVHQ